MHTYLIDTIDKAEAFNLRCRQFANMNKSTLLSHRLQSLLIWWKHFHSFDNKDFGSKRGRNCLGNKSWLRNIQLFVAEKKNKLVGVAPMFLNEVQIKGEKDIFKVLSFCPDSVIFFYQDLLINPENRSMVVSQLFNKIKEVVEKEYSLLFLGNIPEGSKNLPHIRNEMEKSIKDGWYGGETTNCRRGGVYPWNLKQLSRILRSALSDPNCESGLELKIKDLLNAIETQTTALLLFAKTRKEIEEKLLAISDTLQINHSLNKYANKISDSINKKPIEYPFLRLPKNPETLYGNMSSSKRYFYKRYMKKYFNEGASFEKLSPGDIRSSDIDEYLELHALRWQNESAAITKKTLNFHKELCREMAKEGYLRLFFSIYQSKRIAAMSCFDIGNRREFYYSGRVMNLSHLRAGKLIVLNTIIDAIQNGFEIFDFGYGGDAYKYDFTCNYNTLKSFFLIKNNKMLDLKKLFPMFEDISL